MSRHSLLIEVEVDDQALAEWTTARRSYSELPVPDVDEWIFRDLLAAAAKGIVDEDETQIVDYTFIGGSS